MNPMKREETKKLNLKSLILPFTKKYGPLGEITFHMESIKTLDIPLNAFSFEKIGDMEIYWARKYNGNGSVYGISDDQQYKVMDVVNTFPSPYLLIELGLNEIFEL